MNIEYMMIIIDENELYLKENNNYLNNLLALSKDWAEEKCCSSYHANVVEDFLGKNIFVAIFEEQIIAYALGQIKVLKSRTSYNEVAEKSFELDEFYVSKDFRDQGIGKKLYQYLELSIKEKVDLIRTIAISNQYNELLNFYIDQLGLSFNHALLVKRL